MEVMLVVIAAKHLSSLYLQCSILITRYHTVSLKKCITYRFSFYNALDLHYSREITELRNLELELDTRK